MYVKATCRTLVKLKSICLLELNVSFRQICMNSICLGSIKLYQIAHLYLCKWSVWKFFGRYVSSLKFLVISSLWIMSLLLFYYNDFDYYFQKTFTLKRKFEHSFSKSALWFVFKNRWDDFLSNFSTGRYNIFVCK